MAEKEDRVRGLPSIEEARQNRGKIRWPSTKFWGYAGLIMTVCFIFHWKWTEGEVESARQKLLAQQRGAKSALGPRWFPLRDKVEKWTLDLAKDAGAEVVDKDALAQWDFRTKAGIYLRMRVEDAKSVEAIREGAKASLRDAFTSCLVTFPNPNATAGMECKHTHDCPSGEFCNETDHCSKAAQPFNLRVAYRTMNILTDKWVEEVQEASNDISVRMLAANFEDTNRDDMPLATELLQRAQYFLLVLDEVPASSKGDADAGAKDALLASAHSARVALWRLSDDKLVVRLRREAGGDLIGASPLADDSTMAAARRQANSCALALAVRQAMGDGNVPMRAPE